MSYILFEELKKQFAVWNNNGTEELVLVQSGYFASDSWLEKGHCNDVIGSKFGILGYDGRPGWVNKSNIRPLRDMEEFESFKDSCSLVFKRVLELRDLGEKVVGCLELNFYSHFGKASCISEYTLFAKNTEGVWESAHFISNENHSGLPEDILHDSDKEYSSFEEMAEELRKTVLAVQGEDSDIEHYLEQAKSQGYTFIFHF